MESGQSAADLRTLCSTQSGCERLLALGRESKRTLAAADRQRDSIARTDNGNRRRVAFRRTTRLDRAFARARLHRRTNVTRTCEQRAINDLPPRRRPLQLLDEEIAVRFAFVLRSCFLSKR